MTDIKQLLTEILGQHGWHEWREQCCCGWPGERFRETPSGRIQIDATCDEVDEHIADVLLSLPGIAIVELPEPTGSEPATEDENGFVEWEYPQGVVQVFDGGVIGWGRWHFEDATKLREAASALLAAANAAEDADD